MSGPDLSSRVGGGAFLNTTSIINATGPIYVELNDYTSPEVAATYYANMNVIESFFNKIQTTPANQNIPTDITPAEATAIQQAISNLLNLAKNGFVANSTAGTSQVTNSVHFLTQQMASNLDLLIRSFQAVGATNPESSISVIQLAEWKDLATTSPAIQSLMQAILQATAGNRSIQSIIELDYVATGNNLVNEQLTDMNQALTTTQNVVNSLANLQNIKNSLVIPPSQTYHAPTTIPFFTGDPTTISESTLMKLYRGGLAVTVLVPTPTPHLSVTVFVKSASNYFTGPIFPQVTSQILSPTTHLLTPFGISQFNNLIAIQRSLLAFVPVLSAATTGPTATDSASLLGRIKAILHDFSVLFISGGVQAANLTTLTQQSSALQRYLLDCNDPKFAVTGVTPNQGQNNLTFGVTAAQGLNDQQKQLVQQYLYIFQQFYQSASAVLQAVNQMITKMAQNISR